MDTTGMRLDDAIGVPADRTRAAAGPRDPNAERAQLKVLAQEFEALLMNELLGDWRRSLVDGTDEGEASDGMGTMVDLVGSEFGRALAKSGGLGIAAQLLRAFDRQVVGLDSPAPTQEPISTGVAETIVKPQVAPGTGASGPGTVGSGPAAPVTSGFGLRRDPLSGQVKFHAGADLRMAYGAAVTNVAPGRVSFAGDRPGYGLTVVVDHPNGLQTLYAHLSSTAVQVGDTVDAGQVVARSGNSGRSTGPHLHVELRNQGRPVDPSALLKGVKGSADWKAYRSAWVGSAQDPATGDQE